ncbi:MAG: DNA polymerase III subunit alpha, partial [Candidatus Portnoybacteria bacterium CG23_combo_of_CG06-09_8_20_14_all_44_36]
ANKNEMLAWEKELLGLYISEHPLERYRKKLEKLTTSYRQISRNQSGRRIKIGGIINRIKKINTRNGQPMLFVEIEDLTGRFETIVFPKVLEQTAPAWQEDKIVLVSGRLSDRDENLKILCESVKVLE